MSDINVSKAAKVVEFLNSGKAGEVIESGKIFDFYEKYSALNDGEVDDWSFALSLSEEFGLRHDIDSNYTDFFEGLADYDGESGISLTDLEAMIAAYDEYKAIIADNPDKTTGPESPESPENPTGSDPAPAPDKPEVEENGNKSGLTDKAAELFATQLYDSMKGWGTDEEAFHDILSNEGLSADDWVKIMETYNNKYGSFIEAVDADFYGTEQDEIMAELSSKLLEAAESGNKDAIKLISKEIHNGTSGMLGTADEFIAGILDNASDEILASIVENYSSVNKGASIYDDIKGDFSKDEAKKYINRFNNAIVGGTTTSGAESNSTTTGGTNNTRTEAEPAITDECALEFAEQLADAVKSGGSSGTKDFKAILNNKNLTDDDWVKIISAYQENYGTSIISDACSSLSVFGYESRVEQISDKLLSAADAGNSQAIDLLVKELSANMNNPSVIAEIMDNISEHTLYLVMNQYPEILGSDASLLDDIIKNIQVAETEQEYVDKINNVKAKYSRG